MYKLKILSLLLSCTLLFTGCSFLPWNWGRSKPRVERMSGSSEKVAMAKFQTLLYAIENEDTEAIKALFSTTALAEAQDIDGAIDYLFNLFDGEVVSWELDNNSTGKSFETTGEYTLIRSWFTVYTENTIYKFLTLDYNKNTENPDMQGMYTIHGIDYNAENVVWTDWMDMKVPGVYMPEWYVAEG